MTREDMRHTLDSYTEALHALKRLQARRAKVRHDLAASDDIEDIDKVLNEQSNKCADKLMTVLSLIDIFPVGSRKHEVLALKYIDGMSWYKISCRMYLSESACRKVEQMAVDELIAAATSGG